MSKKLESVTKNGFNANDYIKMMFAKVNITTT